VEAHPEQATDLIAFVGPDNYPDDLEPLVDLVRSGVVARCLRG
jgi:hypothetical protein